MAGFDFFGLTAGLDAPNNTGQSNLNNYQSSPLLSSLQTFNQNNPATANPVSAAGTAYQAKDYSTSDLPQFDAMRQRIDTQYSQTQSQAQDALDRQFAAAGGGPGNGAQAKQTENLASSIAQQKGQDLLNVNSQEASTRTALNQQEQQKAFESSEAVQGRQFQQAEFNQQNVMQANELQFSNLSTIAQLDQSYKEAQAENANNQFNQSMSNFQATHSGGLLGGGGLLGTGLGF